MKAEPRALHWNFRVDHRTGKRKSGQKWLFTAVRKYMLMMKHTKKKLIFCQLKSGVGLRKIQVFTILLACGEH